MISTAKRENIGFAKCCRQLLLMWYIRLSPRLHIVTVPKVLSARAVQNSVWGGIGNESRCLLWLHLTPAV